MMKTIRETRVMEIMPDDEIRQKLHEQIRRLDMPPEDMILTWRKEGVEYLLEIVLTGSEMVQSQRLTVGRVHSYAHDAMNALIMSGRRLYFRLRKEFPTLRRKLSRYKCFPIK